MMGLLRAGDEILSSAGIFGGTISLFQNTLGRFGVTTKLVDAVKTEHFAQSINSKTKVIFIETIGNPRMDVPEIPAIAEIARKANIPLVVDSTVTTPVIIHPKDFGADIIIHSTTKFINGSGSAVGGAIIDAGNYDWANGRFDDIKKLAKRAGQLALLSHLRNHIYRDLGSCASPMNSFLMMQSLETLPARMSLHCDNAWKLAGYLQEHPVVSWVNYPGLPDSPFYGKVKKYFGGRGGGLLTFGLGTKQDAFKFIDSLQLAKNLANLGDAKTLVIHPESTLFHDFSLAECRIMGVGEDMVRVSVGIEDIDDIINDFEQAIKKSLKE